MMSKFSLFFQWVGWITLFLLSFPALAQDPPTPSFRLPIACTPGTDCWVLNYVDMGAGDGTGTDPACGARSYDAHKGTDFAVRDRAAMEKGVDVLAALGGNVLRTRDGEPDRVATEADLEAVKEARKECGNAVLIDHGNGLQTMYCHMKQGSVKVRPGDAVETGQAIGQVGLSGYTQYPHVHFGIVRDGKILDPFTGRTDTEPCGPEGSSLWEPSLGLIYEPVVLYAGGIHDAVPTLEAVDAGLSHPEKMAATAEALTFWIAMLGVWEGDEIVLELKNPDGSMFASSKEVQPKTRARQFYFVGRKLSAPLPAGVYTAQARLTRTQTEGPPLVRTLERRVTIE